MNRKLIGNLNFSKALESVKHGERIAREGWNGKGMYLLYIRGSETDNGPNTTWGDYQINENLIDAKIARLPWIGLKTADNKFVPWPASQTDLLAEDWSVVE